MIIGLDFDNTLACYDRVFRAGAAARGLLPGREPMTKEEVRDRLRAAGREDDWTELQGWAYGPGMAEAPPFPGAREFVALCRSRGARVRVISHRTRRPFRGPAYDLHAAARAWLERHRFLDRDTGLAPEDVHLEETKQAKLSRIAEQSCTHFVDDLPEFLAEGGFPAGVERFLFDPARAHAGAPFPRASSWEELGRLLFPPADEATAGAAAALAERAGLRGSFRLETVPGAANNRVFRVVGGGWTARLKLYFVRPDDPRDRFGAETAFSRFAAEGGVRAAPRLLAADRARGAALFEWTEGRRLSPGEADAARVREALSFLAALNRLRTSPAAATLPDASEACFSPEAHRALVGRRVSALASIAPADSLDEEAADFVRSELRPALAEAEKRLARARVQEAELAPAARVLSPSDFGFHNAVARPDGTLSFLDFEYAGWDDPAKTVCDFFLQPAVPAPSASRGEFLRAVGEIAGDAAGVRARADALAPLYRVKWACIALNDFLPAGSGRRRFASGETDSRPRRARQLELARRFLSTSSRDLETS